MSPAEPVVSAVAGEASGTPVQPPRALAARAALHRAALTLPDTAVILAARLLALGTPGSDEVLGPCVVADREPDPGGATALRPASAGEVRVVVAEAWRLLGRSR